MPDPFQDTLATLKAASAEYQAVLVSYSGGKDSLAVLDMCLRNFPRVETFLMSFLPGMRFYAEKIAWVQEQFGVICREYPSWLLYKCIRNAPYSDPKLKYDDLPQWSLGEVYALARADSGIRLIAHGAKFADSPWRRRTLTAKMKDDADVIYPLATWTKRDVVAFCARRGIPVPEQMGCDLTERNLFNMHEKYPDDYERICQVFPYAPAALYRRKLYGPREQGGRLTRSG